MAKKNRTTQHRSSGQGHLSVSGLRADRALSAVAMPFVHWCEQTQDLSAEGALMVLKPVGRFLGAYFELHAASEVTNFDPQVFGTAFLGQMAAVAEEDQEFFWDAIHLYVDFLREAAAWTGTAQDIEQIHDFFREEELPESIPPLEVPQLSAADELAGLASTVLVQRAEALLRWVGAGREVTATGALKLKNIEGAAAAVGVQARGARTAAAKDLATRLAAGTVGGTVRSVRSMTEVSSLMTFWDVLQAAELLHVGSTVARVTPLATRLLGASGTAKLPLLRELVTLFLKVSVTGHAQRFPWEGDTVGLQQAILIAAAGESPPDYERVHAMLTATDGPIQGAMAGRIALRRLEYLAELGLVVLGAKIVVPPAVVASIAAAFAEVFVGGPDADGAFERIDALDPAAPILQLKVSINRASPPIWRRLLVPSDLTLADLHTVIQNSFEWLDYHLHAFQVGGPGGAVYGPPDAESEEPELDERAYTVGGLMPAAGDVMVYTYDFGDDWEHQITVEKILPPDAAGTSDAVVRCTGGRGRGPAEDSGGVWGWEAIIAVMADPQHPEHGEYRQWLGLVASEEFDPTAFNAKALDADLADLF